MSVAVRRDRVPVAPFRDVFLQMEPSRMNGRWGWTMESCKDAANTLAERLGWYDRGVPDGPRVRRVLGLRQYHPSHGYSQRQREHLTYEMALRLCDAMGLDPVDMDL